MKDYSFSRGIHRLWWVPMITGLIAIALGVWCFCSPATSLPVFSYVFAAGIILAGILNLCYAGFNASLGTNWGWSLALGLLELFCGIWLFTLPVAMLAATFAYAVGLLVLFAAINAVCEAVWFARFSAGWAVVMIILLVATIVFGFYFLVNPLFGGVAGWLWIGLSLLCFGIWRIALAFKVRSLNKWI